MGSHTGIRTGLVARCCQGASFGFGFVLVVLMLITMFWIAWCYFGLAVVQISDSQRRAIVNYSFSTTKSPSNPTQTSLHSTLFPTEETSINSISKSLPTASISRGTSRGESPAKVDKKKEPEVVSSLAKGDFAARDRSTHIVAVVKSQDVTSVISPPRKPNIEHSEGSLQKVLSGSSSEESTEESIYARSVLPPGTQNRPIEKFEPENRPRRTESRLDISPTKVYNAETKTESSKRLLPESTGEKSSDYGGQSESREYEERDDSLTLRPDDKSRSDDEHHDPQYSRTYVSNPERQRSRYDDDDRESRSKYDKRDRVRAPDERYPKGDSRYSDDDIKYSRGPDRQSEGSRRRGDDGLYEDRPRETAIYSERDAPKQKNSEDRLTVKDDRYRDDDRPRSRDDERIDDKYRLEDEDRYRTDNDSRHRTRMDEKIRDDERYRDSDEERYRSRDDDKYEDRDDDRYKVRYDERYRNRDDDSYKRRDDDRYRDTDDDRYRRRDDDRYRDRDGDRYRDRDGDRYRDRVDDRYSNAGDDKSRDRDGYWYRDRDDDRYRVRDGDMYRDRDDDMYKNKDDERNRDKNDDRYRDSDDHRYRDRIDGNPKDSIDQKNRDRVDDRYRDRMDDRYLESSHEKYKPKAEDRSMSRVDEKYLVREEGSFRSKEVRDRDTDTHKDSPRFSTEREKFSSRRDENRRSEIPLSRERDSDFLSRGATPLSNTERKFNSASRIYLPDPVYDADERDSFKYKGGDLSSSRISRPIDEEDNYGRSQYSEKDRRILPTRTRDENHYRSEYRDSTSKDTIGERKVAYDERDNRRKDERYFDEDDKIRASNIRGTSNADMIDSARRTADDRHTYRTRLPNERSTSDKDRREEVMLDHRSYGTEEDEDYRNKKSQSDYVYVDRSRRPSENSRRRYDDENSRIGHRYSDVEEEYDNKRTRENYDSDINRGRGRYDDERRYPEDEVRLSSRDERESRTPMRKYDSYPDEEDRNRRRELEPSSRRRYISTDRVDLKSEDRFLDRDDYSSSRTTTRRRYDDDDYRDDSSYRDRRRSELPRQPDRTKEPIILPSRIPHIREHTDVNVREQEFQNTGGNTRGNEAHNIDKNINDRTNLDSRSESASRDGVRRLSAKDVIEAAMRQSESSEQNPKKVHYPVFDPRISNLTSPEIIRPSERRGTTITTKKKRAL